LSLLFWFVIVLSDHLMLVDLCDLPTIDDNSKQEKNVSFGRFTLKMIP